MILNVKKQTNLLGRQSWCCSPPPRTAGAEPPATVGLHLCSPPSLGLRTSRRDGGDDTPKILALYMVLFFSKKNNASPNRENFGVACFQRNPSLLGTGRMWSFPNMVIFEPAKWENWANGAKFMVGFFNTKSWSFFRSVQNHFYGFH